MYLKFLRNITPYLFIAAVAFFMFRGIFATGFMSGHDNSFHYYDAYYLTETLIPQYHWISGWSMQGLAGFPVLVDYYQTGFLSIAFLNKILFFSLNFSYKVIVLLSYIILGAGFYKISSYRFGKIPSLFITLCLMLQKDIYYDRILGGIWSNYLGIGIFFIFFHMMDKNIKTMTVKKAFLLGLLLGLLILTHLYVALFAFLLLVIYMIPYVIEALKNKPFFKQSLIYICIPISALMISSYYLYGFVIARGYFSKISIKDPLTGLVWSLKSFFGPLVDGVDSLSTFMINIPIIIRIIFSFLGIYLFLKKEKNSNIRRFLTVIIVFVFISLVLFSDILGNLFNWWQYLPFIGNLQTNRFLIYAQIGMYLFAAYGIAKFLGYFKRKKLLITACAILLLFSIFFHSHYLARPVSRTLEQSPHMSNVFKVWNWVNKNISPGESRIVYQSTMGNIIDPILIRSDVFALSGVFTKTPQIGVSRSASPFPQEKYMRNDQGKIFGKPLISADANYISETMNYFNAEHIVSVEPNLKNKLNNSTLFFKEEDFGPFSISRLKNFKGDWIDFKGDAHYKIIAFENQRLTFDIWNRSANNEAFVKVAYHPFWRARLNKKPVKIKQDRYSLMKISLPDIGYHRLELSFNSFSPIWVAVSVLSLMGTGLIIMYGDRSLGRKVKSPDETCPHRGNK